MYSWNGVMDFLRDQEKRAQEREHKLIEDKKQVEDRVKQLEEEMKNQIQINKDLVKKLRLMEYQMLQQKRRLKLCQQHHNNNNQNSHLGIGTVGLSGGSGSGGTISGTIVGNTTLTQGNLHGTIQPQIKVNYFYNKNPQLTKPKGVRHQRGNSDGIQNIASRLFTSHHTRGSSGSNGQLKTFEENLDAGAAILSQTLELAQDNQTNSRTQAQNFANYYQAKHNKTNSSDTHETVESQLQLTKVYKQIDNTGGTGSKSYLMPSSAGANISIPQKRRQISNGSQIGQQIQAQHDLQQLQQQQQPQQRQNTATPNSNQVTTITTTTTITQSSAPKSGELAGQQQQLIGQRRKWLAESSAPNQEHEQSSQFINDSSMIHNQSMTTSQLRMSGSSMSRSKNLVTNGIQDRYSKLDKSSNALNTSANSAISAGASSSVGLVTASEDCTIKAWDVNKFSNIRDEEGTLNFEPYVTFRGNVSPIMSICGAESQNEKDIQNIIISGSTDGTLKLWKVPPVQQVDQYGSNQDQSYCVQTWDMAHQKEPIWDLRLHQNESIFLSAGSDYSVGLWQIPQDFAFHNINEEVIKKKSSKGLLLGRFNKHISSHLLMPTSCCWLPNDQNAFLVSYQNPLISVWDASTGQEQGLLTYKMDESKPYILQQINKLVISESQKLIVAGTEDNLIRLFDLNSHKQVKTIVAHTDAITSLLVNKKSSQQMFISGGHDGAVRAWDLRTFQCIYDTVAHRRKYDEGVLSLAQNEKLPLLASGGGDSLIKIMQEQ
ncbi:calmodulin binding protein 3 [Stylonychia lemnae]|uniref:Calmodulin binding protein 3 n=1 Tax=Stylonychia lemnae TaxID=5949 RepID=A0A077ZZ38_STYLE|nr:calmodulin binding protein 3 [Stylonychia lemnae]|eukprot:CDW73793.1 calmodulin binding protein 3 [Stylonychia lemnae]